MIGYKFLDRAGANCPDTRFGGVMKGRGGRCREVGARDVSTAAVNTVAFLRGGYVRSQYSYACIISQVNPHGVQLDRSTLFGECVSMPISQYNNGDERLNVPAESSAQHFSLNYMSSISISYLVSYNTCVSVKHGEKNANWGVRSGHDLTQCNTHCGLQEPSYVQGGWYNKAV